MLIKMNISSFNKLVKLINKADNFQEMLGMPANNTMLIRKFTVLEDNTVELEMSNRLFDAYLDMGMIYLNCLVAGTREYINNSDKVFEILETALDEFGIR